MKFKIPFTIGSMDALRRRHTFFKKYIKPKRRSLIQISLSSANVGITREEYLSISLFYFFFSLIAVTVVLTTGLYFAGVSRWPVYGVVLGLLFSGFIFLSQTLYPRVFANRRQRSLERNLLPALQDMLVQLNSGIPLFNILVNISASDYGELSEEFKIAVKKMSAGVPQGDVLEELGDKNSSSYFKKTLWQISNGLKAGSDLGVVIKESLISLNEEQILQIQTYGNKLNPMIMFYMLVSVVVPALSVTFLTILSSMINLSQSAAILLFIALFVFVLIIQVVFLGVIKSTRPSLL